MKSSKCVDVLKKNYELGIMKDLEVWVKGCTTVERKFKLAGFIRSYFLFPSLLEPGY